MSISRVAPPLDYLQAASRASLQSFELTRLNHAANLRQEIAALIDQWIQETSEALLARWMLDHHKSLQARSAPASEEVRTLLDSTATLFPEFPYPGQFQPVADRSRTTQPSTPELVPAPRQFAAPRSSLKSPLPRRPQKQRQSAAL
jgi:hypothetical protein